MRKAIPQLPTAPPGSLAAALASVPEPRQPYGWRPEYPPLPLVALLQLTVAAVLCGARGLSAIAQWGQERLSDAPELLLALGLPAGRSPCVATLHRIYKALDVPAFERAVGGWLQTTGVDPQEPVALDGKTLRGVHGVGVPGVHLVAAYGHESHTVLAQMQTTGKGHELAAGKQLLEVVPLAGRAQRAPGRPMRCSPSGRCASRSLGGAETTCSPWTRTSPPAARIWRRFFSLWEQATPVGAAAPELPVWYLRELTARGGAWSVVSDRGDGWAHGRQEWRILWLLADPEFNAYVGSAGTVGTAWPHVQQVFRLERHRTCRENGIPVTTVEVTYGITSVPADRADATAVLRVHRGHWGIENGLHHVRDVTFDEDRCQVRTGAAPQLLAACRNLAIGLLYRKGARNIAAALRTCAGRPKEAVALICHCNQN